MTDDPLRFNRNFYSPDKISGFSDLVPAKDKDGKLIKDAAGRQVFETKIVAPSWPDGSDAYANLQKTVLSFQNIRNKDEVFFKAFITAFNESFTPNFNATEVFGRTDPIMQYKNTTRSITLAWKMPAASEGEAYENLGKVQKLITMLYPTYTDVQDALSLSEAPLVRLKLMNLLQKVQEPGSTTDKGANQIFTEYQSLGEGAGNGILGVVTSCTVNHNLEGTDGVFQKLGATNTVLPKLIDVNISFTPLHEKTLTGNQNVSLYGVNLSGKDKATEDQLVDSGKSLTEIRALKRTLEEKRRTSAKAQQELDKANAKARRAFNKLDKDKDLNKRQARKVAEARKANAAVYAADFDLLQASFDDDDIKIEDLI